MDIIQLIVLSLVQGITEFLPVSSSAHLILVPKLTGWQDQGLLFDVAVHVGTLLAVLLYYRKDVLNMLLAFGGQGFKTGMNADARLAWAVILATIPLGLAGLFGKDFIEQNLRDPLVIAASTLVFGVLLGLAAWMNKAQRQLGSMTGVDILVVGAAQALALIPGTSRSGITITAALLRRFEPQEAARFSFLLSIPAILMPFSLYLLELIQTPDIEWDLLSLALAIALSFISALGCIHLFLKLLEKIGMLPFVIYRLLLGAVLLWVFWPL